MNSLPLQTPKPNKTTATHSSPLLQITDGTCPTCDITKCTRFKLKVYEEIGEQSASNKSSFSDQDFKVYQGSNRIVSKARPKLSMKNTPAPLAYSGNYTFSMCKGTTTNVNNIVTHPWQITTNLSGRFLKSSEIF